MFNIFSSDIAVDIGSATIKMIDCNNSALFQMENCIAILETKDKSEHLLTSGKDALAMTGRNAERIKVCHPFVNNRINDMKYAVLLLQHMLHNFQGRALWGTPTVTMLIPENAKERELVVYRQMWRNVGCRNIHFESRVQSSARGLQIPYEAPKGFMLIDFGQYNTEISILSCGGVVSYKNIHLGGQSINENIIHLMRLKHKIQISEEMAEKMKRSSGSAVHSLAPEELCLVMGMSLTSGMPRTVSIPAIDISNSIWDTLSILRDCVDDMLHEVDASIASDIVRNGVVLYGGSSHILNLDIAMSNLLSYPVIIPNDPELVPIKGMLVS